MLLLTDTVSVNKKYLTDTVSILSKGDGVIRQEGSYSKLAKPSRQISSYLPETSRQISSSFLLLFVLKIYLSSSNLPL